MKIIIAGGGTGGHIYPAIAIAEELKRQFPTCEILFVGAEGKMEMEKVPKAGYPIIGLPIRGLQRRLTPENLLFPFRLLGSLWQALGILKNFKPDIVIGTGGYASGAMVQVAAWKGVKTLIQEQNSYAGLTNKLLAKSVGKVCVAYPNMERYFPAQKVVFCGNPVRKDLRDLTNLRPEAAKFFGLSSEKTTVLVIGGSLGARTINRCMEQVAPQLLDQGVQLIWQTGKAYYAEAQAAVGQWNKSGVYCRDFIYEMQLAYSIADLVVSRAGALSVSEICLAQKAAILVPSPNVAEDHQTKNAQALADRQAAVLVSDATAATELLPALQQLLDSPAQRNQLAQNAFALAKPAAAEEIVTQIKQLLTE
jgi:UDP-N-acetylglucosamine--N-acetylmuramyl-(pentapeptide) pyrophosphoryl-undecaprenol N-acetylglucosamine transferase